MNAHSNSQTLNYVDKKIKREKEKKTTIYCSNEVKSVVHVSMFMRFLRCMQSQKTLDCFCEGSEKIEERDQKNELSSLANLRITSEVLCCRLLYFCALLTDLCMRLHTRKKQHENICRQKMTRCLIKYICLIKWMHLTGGRREKQW